MTELGPVAYGENKDHIFLGQEIERSQNYSEQTAQKIDTAIHDIVEEQYHRSLEILNKHRKELDVCAEALLEHETIDGKHVLEILEFGEMRSPVIKREIVSENAQGSEGDGVEDSAAEEDNKNSDKGELAGEDTPVGAPA